jgi:hypothetical protein
MNSYNNELLSTTAVSITDASIGIVLALCALFMLFPFVMLVGLIYSGIRQRSRKGRPGDG